MYNTLDLLKESGFAPRRASSRDGGEHHAPCPGCGGTDRFHVWPDQNNGNGSYWCRGCERHGDNIQFCIDFLGLSFRDAAVRCGREELITAFEGTPTGSWIKPLLPPKSKKDSETPWQPVFYKLPPAQWIDKANELAQQCHRDLLDYPEAMVWLASRGISKVAVLKHCLGWNKGKDGQPLFSSRASWGLPPELNDKKKSKPLWIPVGLVIPYLVDNQVVRLRIRRPQREREKFLPKRKYHVIPGSFMGTMVLEPGRKAHVVIEAELDAIACVTASDLCSSVAVQTVGGKPDKYTTALLRNSLQILNSIDFGDVGAGQQAAARAKKFWETEFKNSDRWPVPEGKDPGEAYKAGVNLALWLKTGLPPVMTIESSVSPVVSHEGGHFLSGVEEEGGQEAGEAAEVVAEEEVSVVGQTVPAVLRLSALLKQTGSHIYKQEGDYSIVSGQGSDFSLMSEVSGLVFFNDEVTNHIEALPDGKYFSSNIIRR